MATISGLVRLMERAARKAGQRLRRDFGEVEHLQVSKKGPADFVTKADRASERTLYDELGKARPDWGFLMEEAGSIDGEEGAPRWIVDPLDGTTNFLHSLPHFAISIAVQEPRLDGKGWGEITAALVYQPITDESFWAEKNNGAWLQDRRLRVSARRHLDESLIATGIPFAGYGDAAQWTKIYRTLAPQVAGIRRLGCASLDLAWLAAGRYEAFWEEGLSPWDTAAGGLLVREAGGFVTDWKGRSAPVCDATVLAGNNALHSRIHKQLVTALNG